jgi:hypothetical protein
MARVSDLMGLGMAHLLAARIGEDPVLITVAGVAAGSATQIGPTQSAVYVNSSNSGSGIKMPNIGGDPGCLLGDDFTITNSLGQSICVYAANNASGSIVIFMGNGASTTGTTGVSIATGQQGYFQAITPSVWAYTKTSA